MMQAFDAEVGTPAVQLAALNQSPLTAVFHEVVQPEGTAGAIEPLSGPKGAPAAAPGESTATKTATAARSARTGTRILRGGGIDSIVLLPFSGVRARRLLAR